MTSTVIFRHGDLADSHYETVDLSTGEVSARVPEFNRMSLKPGIGAEWIKRYNKDVYPRDVVIARGHESKPPYRDWETDRKSTRLNSSHRSLSRMPSSA